MATYVISPGAWLAGSGLYPEPRGKGSSGLYPEPRGQGSSGLYPEPWGQGGSDLYPEPESGGQSTQRAGWYPEPLPSSGARRSAPTAPWRGVDPAWVYQGGPEALLAQALERTRAKIIRPSDPRALPQTRGLMQAPAAAVHTTVALWRWGGEYRVQAVLADLGWRLRVEHVSKTRLSRLLAGGVVTLTLPDFTKRPPRFAEDQIDKVQRAAVEREGRLPEILAQRDDLWPFLRMVLGAEATVSPRLEELMAVAWRWATPLVMALKNDVAALRPVQFAASVLPVIPTPTHGSLPSGHATMAALSVEILTQLLLGGDQTHPRAVQLDRLARRIAFNRVVAGVHFPLDSAVGYGLGLQLAGHFVAWATGRKAYKAFVFDPDKHSQLTESGVRPSLKPARTAAGKSAPLALLWDAAHREADRGGA